ncbi:MAG: DNA-3-methyladenine glycosylase [Marinoscillum sp.]|jgi:DNA-3-methyladenine glycosylase
MIDLSTYEKVPESFYQNDEVVSIAQRLVGKYLVTNIKGIITVGRIVETEAYNGRTDRACHAFQKCTPRTETMYLNGGVAYTYLCYGIHRLFNIVTNVEGKADAVLIRAVEPMEGVDHMFTRRRTDKSISLTSGPGKLSEALGIKMEHDALSLQSDEMWIGTAKRQNKIQLVADVRIGVDYAGEDALLPWRFYENENPYVSVKKKTSAFAEVRL